MRFVVLAMLAAAIVLAVSVLASDTGAVEAHGNSPAKRQNAGWFCVNVEGLGVHCFPPGSGASGASMPVQYFDTTDPSDTHGAFLGTEILIHQDIYHGQPCPQEDSDDYHDLSGDGLPYFACHHPKGSP